MTRLKLAALTTRICASVPGVGLWAPSAPWFAFAATPIVAAGASARAS